MRRRKPKGTPLERAQRAVALWSRLAADMADAVAFPEQRRGGVEALARFQADLVRYETNRVKALERIRKIKRAQQRAEERKRFWENCLKAAP